MTRVHSEKWLRFAAWLSLAWLIPLGLNAEPIDFREQVQPLLSKNCTACHGGVKQAGGISFNFQEGSQGIGKSGNRTVVPGNPDASELIRRITSTDPEEKMPPVDEHPEGLTDAEVALFKQWIAEGAVWTEHWAFEKPEEPEIPSVDSHWPRTVADALILARLEEENLRPSSEADRAQWLRRASLDATGLPPTAESQEAFVQDASPEAYERVVDRLLASPAFGERWAGMWLDLARYADSQGFEKDGHRDMWAYRDWVINAFNEDMPFDQFTIKQLAGDLLPNPSLGDLVATSFHRNTQTNTEGGTDDEEFRVAAVIDRVNTTWTVWGATTFLCVQCHSHPYDAIRHEEFYQFMAFFNNTEDVDLGDDYPRMAVPLQDKDRARARELDLAIEAQREWLNHQGKEIAEADASWSPLEVESITGADSVEFKVTGHEVIAGGTIPAGSTYHVTTPARSLTAVRVEILPESEDLNELPENGSVLSHFKMEVVNPDEEVSEVPFSAVFAPALTGPYDPEESLKEGAAGGGSYPKIDRPVWLVFLPKEEIVVEPGSSFRLALNQSIQSHETKGGVVRRFRLMGSSAPQWTALAHSEERTKRLKELAKLKGERRQIASTSVPVMKERPDPAKRDTHMFRRGNFLDKDKEVTPGVPGVLNPIEGEEDGVDRLDMARWWVSNDNPLTARVFVNRVWAELFGTGLVETVEDFGSTGTRPSHPEVLDHLAVRFQTEHRWSLKQLLREILLSASYRQDHRHRAELAERDPDNRLLARGPRTRLTAEMVRDQALRASSLLSAKIGGPSVRPPQPEGVWSVVYSGDSWVAAEGVDRYRRAVYTYWRRTSPYPSFLSFDAPSREVCTARRIPTNTPLQALVTLNDPVYIEAAQALAERMTGACDQANLAEMFTLGYRWVTQKEPDGATLEALLSLYKDAVQAYEQDPLQAEALAGTAQQAALVLIASTLLNIDDALTK